MNTAIKNVLTLTIITLIAGFCLGFVYDVTKEPIAMMAEKTKQEACRKVFPSADSFAEDTSIDIAESDAIIEQAVISGVSVDEVLKALDASGNSLGYVIILTSHEGYGGDIEISMGIDNSGCVLGVEILSISETAGLGMKADTEEFKSQFKNKTVTQFVYTKVGASQEFEIDALSGATITTKAFTNAVNAGLAYFRAIGGNS